MTAQTAYPAPDLYGTWASALDSIKQNRKFSRSKQDRAVRCMALENYFIRRAIFSAARDWPHDAALNAKRAVIAGCLVQIHQANNNETKEYWIANMMHECQMMAPW